MWKSWREHILPPPTRFIALCLVDTGVPEFSSQLADVGLELTVHRLSLCHVASHSHLISVAPESSLPSTLRSRHFHRKATVLWTIGASLVAQLVKKSACHAGCRRLKTLGFDLWVGKIPWRRAWRPTPEFLPGGSHGQRSLEGYSPWGCKALNSEHAHTS